MGQYNMHYSGTGDPSTKSLGPIDSFDRKPEKVFDIHGLPPTAYWEAAEDVEVGTGRNPALAAFSLKQFTRVG